MSLVESRDRMRETFEKGDRPAFLFEYERKRDSEYWRSTRFVETLCEYILYLESKNKLESE